MIKTHSLEARRRAFHIWQELGYNPWGIPKEVKRQKDGSFYKGAFDSIPFLNDDAKRTFVELLFRPGYMIRDYIRGAHDKYLAPLAALIIFYSFFALLSAVLQPYQQNDPGTEIMNERIEEAEEIEDTESSKNLIVQTLRIIKTGYEYLSLDQHPERVDTRHEQAIAAMEGSLRSQGIPLFVGKLILLWLSFTVVLRRYRMSSSACATAAAYILCQFSFFMLFALIATFGENSSLSTAILFLLIIVDLHQMLGLPWKTSIRKAIAIGIWYAVLYGAFLFLVSALVVLIAFLKS